MGRSFQKRLRPFCARSWARNSSAAGSLKAVVFLSQRILVRVACLLRGQLCIVERESGVIPLFHLNHRVVWCRKRFLGANRIYPAIHRLLVRAKQLVEIQIIHKCEVRNDPAIRQSTLPSFHGSFTMVPRSIVFTSAGTQSMRSRIPSRPAIGDRRLGLSAWLTRRDSGYRLGLSAP